MGASNIDFKLHGKASRTEIDKAFKKQVEQDREYNGTRDGYSGDFQTVNKVDYSYLDDKIFSSESEAYDFCLDKAQKWDTVVAVYYNEAAPIESNTIYKLRDKATKLADERTELNKTPLDKSKEFKTCVNCKSRIALKHARGNECPVCEVDMRSKKLVNKLANMSTKIKQLIDRKTELIKAAQEKQAASGKNIKTLVAGWGAC